MIKSHLDYPDEFAKMGLLFYKKAQLMNSFVRLEDPLNFETIVELNRLRKKLAHEADFSEHLPNLKNWTAKVFREDSAVYETHDQFGKRFIDAAEALIEFFNGYSKIAK